jgi:hypothetical protein
VERHPFSKGAAGASSPAGPVETKDGES